MALLVFDVVGPRLQSKRYLGQLGPSRLDLGKSWCLLEYLAIQVNHDRFVENAQDSDRSLGRSAVRR